MKHFSFLGIRWDINKVNKIDEEMFRIQIAVMWKNHKGTTLCPVVARALGPFPSSECGFALKEGGCEDLAYMSLGAIGSEMR